MSILKNLIRMMMVIVINMDASLMMRGVVDAPDGLLRLVRSGACVDGVVRLF